MSNSLIPVRSPTSSMASKPPTICTEQTKIKYKPIFKQRKVPTVILAEVEPEPNKCKVTCTPAARLPAASRRHISTENGYAIPKREQLTSAPRLRIVGEPELSIQKSTPATCLPVPSKVNLGNYNPVGYTMSTGLVQQATSVSAPPKAKLGDINTVYKCEQPTSGLHPQTTSELKSTTEKATPISQSVDSSEVDFDNDNDNNLRNGNPAPEDEQIEFTPCVPVKDESKSVVPKTPDLCLPGQNTSAIESEDSIQHTLSGGVIFADESPKGTNITIGQELDTPRLLDSGGEKGKLKNKRTGSDLEASDEEGEEAWEAHDSEQMDCLQEAPLPIRKILKPTARNCVAVFHQKTLAAWSALNLAISQAIQILHSNPAAGPATPQMVVDFLGSGIIGHAILRENLEPKAIRAAIENLLLEYHQRKAEKAKDSARFLQKLELGFEIKDLHMLDYGMDDAVGAPESFIMDGVEATTGHSYFSKDLDSLVFHQATTVSFVSTLASPEGEGSEELVDYESTGDFSDISDEIMEESKNSTAMVLRMLEYGDTDDEDNSEISQSTRSHSPEFTTGPEGSCSDSVIVMEVDETEDLPSIEELSLITDMCMSEAPDTVVSSGDAGPEDVQHLSLTEAGDFAMAENIEGVDNFATTDTGNTIEDEYTRYSDGIKEFLDPGSTKGLGGTGNIRNIGENNSPDRVEELNETNDILMSEEEERGEDLGTTFSTKEVVGLSFLSGLSVADSEGLVDTVGVMMAEANGNIGTTDIINHPSPAEETDNLNCIGLVNSKGLYGIEEILVTKEMDTNGSLYIEEFDNMGPLSAIEEIEGPEIMRKREVLDVTIDLDATVVGAVGITTAQISNVITMDDKKVAGFPDATQTTVNGADIGDIDSSVEGFDGVGAVEFVQFSNLPQIFASTDLSREATDGSIGDPKSIYEATTAPEASRGPGGAPSGTPESEDLTQELESSLAEDILELSFNSDEECSNVTWEELYDLNNNPSLDYLDVDEQIDITQIQGGEMKVYLCVAENVGGRNSSDNKISYISGSGSIEEASKGKDIFSTEEVDKVNGLKPVEERLCRGLKAIELEQLSSTTQSLGLCCQSELEWYSGTEEYLENQDQEEEEEEIQRSIQYADFAKGIDDLDEKSADEDIGGWIIDWFEGLPSEAEHLEEMRKEEEEKEKVIAGNIEDLSPIWASCERKQKSWEGFPHNQAPALAVERAPTPTVVVILPKNTATPITGRRKYIWGLIFCFICISALLAVGSPSTILNRFQVYAPILESSGIQSKRSILRFFIRQAADVFPDFIGTQEISLLVFIQISMRWRSRETVETNVSRVVWEIIGLVWVVISCIAVGLGVIYTSGMDLVNALRFAGVKSQPAVGLQVSKPQQRNVVRWEDIAEVKRDNSTGDGVEMGFRLHEELWKELAVNEVTSSLLLRLEGPAMSGFPLPTPDEISPRYILGVGSGVSTKSSGTGVADVGVSTLGLGLMSLLMFGGGRRRQLRRGGRRLL